jgi:hypothetical protein
LSLHLQDDKEINVETIHELPLQKLRVKDDSHPATGEEANIFLKFLAYSFE